MIRSFILNRTANRRAWSLLLLCGLVILPLSPFEAAAKAPKLPVVPKWGRFEQTFRSSFAYSNALQEATLTVWFTSPLGESNRVEGFWDGGKTWRVRFSPNQPGRWKFKTICSDAANDGLNHQSGEFLCSAPIGPLLFKQHGPVRVARDHRHFEYEDGTPFFWLADTVWIGPRVADPKDWQLYARVRVSQDFTVAQWSVAPGENSRRESAVTGFPERIGINPEFFKLLDAKVELLSRAGIISAIAPLSELESETSLFDLPDDQATLLVRYIVARWGAEPVVWLLAFEGDPQARKVGRWKRIGQSVFAGRAHAPVILYPGQTAWVLDEFRDQDWVDAFALQNVTDTTEDALKWAFSGPFANEWNRQPTRPLLMVTPPENGLGAASKKRFTAEDVRRAAYWGVLGGPPAGVSYGGLGVSDWDASTEPKEQKDLGSGLPLWQRALFMPGAKQMGQLGKFMNSVEFWRLRPQQDLVATQPGESATRRWLAAAATPTKNLAMVYAPEDRTVELVLETLPASPVVTWVNPRTGETSPAVAVVAGRACQFPSPDPGDWLLVVRAGGTTQKMK
jgi:hypothetical protein